MALKVRVVRTVDGMFDWSVEVVNTKNNQVMMSRCYSELRKATKAAERLLKGFSGQKKVEVVGNR